LVSKFAFKWVNLYRYGEASDRSARARADEYAEEAKKLRARMAGSMRAAQDVGAQRAAAAEDEAADTKLALQTARREVRELTDEVAALRRGLCTLNAIDPYVLKSAGFNP
jgi:hypothetical protein